MEAERTLRIVTERMYITMDRILVLDTLKKGGYPEAGRVLYEEIMSRAESADKIIIDFDGVQCVATQYITTSIGRLIKEKGYDFVKSKLSFANIYVSQAARIKKYVKAYANDL